VKWVGTGDGWGPRLDDEVGGLGVLLELGTGAGDGSAGNEALALTQLLASTLLQLLLAQANTLRYSCIAMGLVHAASSSAAAIPLYPRRTVPSGTPMQISSAGRTAGQVTV
jgi:hypothetical protein